MAQRRYLPGSRPARGVALSLPVLQGLSYLKGMHEKWRLVQGAWILPSPLGPEKDRKWHCIVYTSEVAWRQRLEGGGLEGEGPAPRCA